MIQVGLFLPFISDHWHSIERFSQLLQEKSPLLNSHLQINLIRPNQAWEKWGSSLARRGIYTASAAFHKYDVYHIVDQSYAHVLQFLPHKKVLVTCHDLEFWRKRNAKNSLIRRWMAKSLLMAGQISTPTHVIQKELFGLAQEMQLPLPISQVIPNSCGEEFKKSLQSDPLFKKWNLQKRPLLLNLANTAWPRKNFSFLIELLKDLKSEISNILLIQVGPAWSAEHQHKIRQYHLTDHIKHFENLSSQEIVELYQVADLYLQPSTYEGFGYPLLESVACNTPFLASNIDVFAELLPGHKGLLALESIAWQKEIKNILSSSEVRENLLTEQQQLLSRYSWKNQIQSYVKIYEALAKN